MRRLAVLLLVLAACEPASVGPALPGESSSALVPGGGEGPFVLAKHTRTRCGFQRGFWCMRDLDEAERVLDRFTAGTLDAEWAFRLPRAVNFSDGRSGTLGRPDAFALRDLFDDDGVDHVSASFSGLLEIPAGLPPNTWSFAVGSDDGFRLRLFDGAATQVSEHVGPRGFEYGLRDGAGREAFVVTFPPAGGAFPFELTWFDGGSDAGLELLARAGSHPTFDGSAAWSDVPRERLHAPDLRASMVAEKAGSGDVSSGDELTWTVVLRNVGQAPAHPLQDVELPGGVTEDGLAFSACLAFGMTFEGFGALPAGTITRTNRGNCPTTRVYAIVPGPLAPGQEVTLSFRTTVRGFPTQRVCNQGWVAANTTARPDIGRSRLRRLTDDPSEAGSDDTANARTAFDPAGGGDDDPSCVVIGDPAPTFGVTSPAEGETVATERPTITGNARNGAVIDVALTGPGGATASCTATAVAPGTWSCLPASSLLDGEWTLVARLRDASGSLGPSVRRTFVVATPPPEKPVLDPPVSPTGDPLPTFTGATRPFATVELLDAAGAVVCTTTADAAGRFACGLATPLAETTHVFRARATDVNARPSPLSDPVSVRVDFTGPAAPILTSPAALTNERQPVFAGRAEPGAIVVVSEGTTQLCSATADATGAFSCTSTRPLGEGAHTVSALPVDELGNVGTPAHVTFTVDSHAPAPPVLDAMPAVVTTLTPTFRGTVEAGTRVSLRVVLTSGAFGAELCRVEVAPDRFECTSGTALEQGAWVVEAQAVDAAGNVSAACGGASGCRQQVRFVVDDGPPAAPRFDPYPPAVPALPALAGFAESGGTVQVIQPVAGLVCQVTARDGRFQCPPRALPDGSYQFTAYVTDALGQISDPGTLQISVDSVRPGTPQLDPVPAVSRTPRQAITGRAEAGARVQVREAGVVACETTADAAGAFSCIPAADLAQGPHAVEVVAVDAAGNESPPAAASFLLDSVAPAAPRLDALASPLPTATVTVTGTSEPGATLRIFGETSVIGTTTVGPDGVFACPLDPLAEGAHTLRATATDAAGNESPPSAPLTFSVDTTPPSRPTLDPPASPTSDARPTLRGTADADAVVVVRIGDHDLCQAAANDERGWSCRVIDDLGDGTWELRAFARDDLYRWSESSDPRWITVDRTPPPAPVILTPGAFEKVEFFASATGTAAEAARVELYVDDASIGFAEVVDGAWRYGAEVDPGHSLGPHVLSAVAIDAAGNRGPESAPVTFEVVGGYFLVGGCSVAGAEAGLLALLGVVLARRRRGR